MAVVPDQEVIAKKLAMRRPLAGTVAAIDASYLCEWLGMLWYAATAVTCPDREIDFVSVGDDFEPAGSFDEERLRYSGLDAVRANLATGWLDRRDSCFEEMSGAGLLSLNAAQYQKHQMGATDTDRQDVSARGDASQLLVKFDRFAQDRICDQVLGQFFAVEILENGELYSPLRLKRDPADFLEQWTQAIAKLSFRIPAMSPIVIGYDEGKPVRTLYLEVNLQAGYHLYPVDLPEGSGSLVFFEL